MARTTIRIPWYRSTKHPWSPSLLVSYVHAGACIHQLYWLIHMHVPDDITNDMYMLIRPSIYTHAFTRNYRHAHSRSMFLYIFKAICMRVCIKCIYLVKACRHVNTYKCISLYTPLAHYLHKCRLCWCLQTVSLPQHSQRRERHFHQQVLPAAGHGDDGSLREPSFTSKLFCIRAYTGAEKQLLSVLGHPVFRHALRSRSLFVWCTRVQTHASIYIRIYTHACMYMRIHLPFSFMLHIVWSMDIYKSETDALHDRFLSMILDSFKPIHIPK